MSRFLGYYLSVLKSLALSGTQQIFSTCLLYNKVGLLEVNMSLRKIQDNN